MCCHILTFHSLTFCVRYFHFNELQIKVKKMFMNVNWFYDFVSEIFLIKLKKLHIFRKSKSYFCKTQQFVKLFKVVKCKKVTPLIISNYNVAFIYIRMIAEKLSYTLEKFGIRKYF